MYVLFEEDGSFKIGHILSEADAALQVESSTGKRSKIKRSHCLYNFATPAPDELLAQADALSHEIDLQFLWECAPQEEFDVEALSLDYFGHAPTTLEKTTLLLRLHSAPVYFHRRGRGRYKAAPPEILTVALAALEKKQRQAALTQEWADQMVAGTLPSEVAEIAVSLITRPDKNSQVWKAIARGRCHPLKAQSRGYGSRLACWVRCQALRTWAVHLRCQSLHLQLTPTGLRPLEARQTTTRPARQGTTTPTHAWGLPMSEGIRLWRAGTASSRPRGKLVFKIMNAGAPRHKTTVNH